MNNPVDVVEIRQTFQDGHCEHGDDFYLNWADFFVYPIERSLVHKLHANADIGFGKKGSVRRDNIW